MKYILLIFAIIFFSACSIKEYSNTQTKIFIIKSPQIKFADIGYIRNTNEAVELELFMAGKVIERISINHLICVRNGCMSKRGFNEDYLHPTYPDNILQNILLGNEIYDGQNRIKTDNGFEQNIESKYVDIIYKVNKDSILFKDRKNRIIFKIKDTK